ncbi:MAG TPA: bifunctional diaminohydroxyphosphoribosylaminopyrimidine deaminase/5-amino-6-(5-phosphoribosylamino)uracil reductase RibD [Pyrinomonadaceae bacterium]|nr:bifunctional diaminohydroxyphosphoribosylaminopyrimidine deaminase/5-amino-6-(5-phosphoribosylamino)uracil reductase RibD [Pyrinomonadaceae bacterium]
MSAHQITAAVENTTSWSEIDRRMMRRAIELALNGVGQVSPGPLVGCVIATPAGEIVGEGFYVYERIKHAETYALEEAGSQAKGATAYVSLEPHAHHGRTAPCTAALLNAGIARVVAPHEDPNPKVSGKGFAHLREAGVEVGVGVLAREAETANEKYLHFVRTGRPFVHLKLATSLDGKIATRTGDSRWITGPESRAVVHDLRHEYDAILIGAGTQKTDDPLLTDRSGKRRRQSLIRVLLDEKLSISSDSQLARTAGQSPVIVFAGVGSTANESLPAEVELVREASGGRDPLSVLNELGKRSIQSVLIEGGASVAGCFLDAGLVDKISFFVAPKIIGSGDAPTAIAGEGATVLSDAVQLENVQLNPRGADIEITGYPRYKDAG